MSTLQASRRADVKNWLKLETGAGPGMGIQVGLGREEDGAFTVNVFLGGLGLFLCLAGKYLRGKLV